MKLVLASKSPRRREILEHMGVEFSVIVEDVDEHSDADTPVGFVETAAERKNQAVSDEVLREVGLEPAEVIVLSVDTVVVSDGRIMGKPKDETDAREMLGHLSDKTHEVISGFALRGPSVPGRPGKIIRGHATTQVAFDRILPSDLDAYLLTSEPYDKAGAYAIQGHGVLWVKSICGDYNNVVGLPVFAVNACLKEHFGIALTDFE